MDPKLLMQAVDHRRVELGEARGGDTLSLTEVANALGVHSAMFSRLKQGKLPNAETQEKLLAWLEADADEFETCGECPSDELAADADPEDVEVEAVEDNPAIVASEDAADAEEFAEGDEDEQRDTEQTAAIHGSGRLSDSEDPETQAAIVRVKELLREGAVGVSIAHDMDPASMPSEAEIKTASDKCWEDDDCGELEALEERILSRPRHVAIVDTPAFSDARITLNDDGTVEGPLVFEGTWTGDARRLPFGSLQWDEDLLPIPIIWDRQDGDHTGMTVGYIDKLWRIEGEDSALRPEPVQEEAVTAAASATAKGALPARYFQPFRSKAAEPVHVDAPDANGMRRVWGHAAPRGVCHRSDMGSCFQYPGDVDKAHRGFHTGAAVTLDNGETVRVGALTMGGAHLDTGLARRGVAAADTGNHRDNANRTLAMVRAWEDNHGLAFSGVLMPDASPADLLRAQASAPSVELWPSGSGRTLVGIHLVPTPAWPVTASAGEAELQMGITDPVVVEGSEELTVTTEFTDETYEAVTPEQWADAVSRLERIEKALAILVETVVDDIPDPDDPPEE